MSEENNTVDAPIKRTSRANNTRDKKAMRKPWSPPSMLDAPPAPDGYKHRWIKTNIQTLKPLLLNQVDTKVCLE